MSNGQIGLLLVEWDGIDLFVLDAGLEKGTLPLAVGVETAVT